MKNHSVLITGIGLVSSMGEGVDAHWAALDARQKPRLDKERFAPYTVHNLGEIDWNTQIPKRSDQRQMETWQRLGTYAAGLALEDAGLKGEEQFTSTMDMIVAAGGGERDVTVDTQILAKARGLDGNAGRGVMLNQMLSTELRPTLFLAQLSNLLAGNISIVHKVTGSSRTFMGEEGSGLSAVETAVARIRAGQSSHLLVGASYNAEHYDMLLGHELGGYLKSDGWAPVWSRENSRGGGLVTGSGGVFLVLESAEHAKARGKTAYAEIQSVITGQTNRGKKPLAGTLAAMIGEHKEQFTVSGASGVHAVTAAEKTALTEKGLVYRGFSTRFGHMREAQFPFALALAALAVQKGQAFAALEKDEPAASGPIDSALAVTAGICRAEGVARIIKV
ncbi:MAG: 3-oxoacyl-[acyl-carrier-protein] synthase II [Candidatus Tokpelaia hoelldobleri]|uniref:3-oxoacyl-[acyl-carrier-protein] synthase II n=1 Tax=Candidatus Tokpelaia hoelldobleri TaxID=1902579 RepID=A0A1U9JUU5_9HYPH|nr:MAG: 3-oxoacyl-[acyl-carrier-protein] synthase II [Candidatus Tokpelaia hoelldoblerii]